ncbi:MAG: gluconate:H+ symporter [Vulcanimicrobiota bacterium]
MGSLLVIAALGLAGLIVLVVALRLHAFVALLIVSMAVGLGAGLEPSAVLKAVETGMGSTLGFIAVVVGLGAMFGQLLEESGGAQRLATTLVERFGPQRAPWALMLTGFMVAIPVFFDVGFIILAPLVYGLSRQSGRPVVAFGMPLLAGLAVAHAFVPPTPGPVAVAQVLQADLGRVILYGIAAGLPAAVIAGPLWSSWLEKRITKGAPEHDKPPEEEPAELPSFALVFGLVAIPLVLIVANTASAALLPDTTVATVFSFLGHPFTALILATLAAFLTLGVGRGKTLDQVREAATRGLEPVGMIILVTGAGGVFKQILGETGIGKELAQAVMGLGLSPVLFAFLVALLVRVSQGSATVSMLTAAGFVAPLLPSIPDADPALLTIAIAAGATACSHFNDSGFWLVKEYLGLSETETLQSWTTLTTILGVVGLLSAWAASLVL